jgi:hypothetical protein
MYVKETNNTLNFFPKMFLFWVHQYRLVIFCLEHIVFYNKKYTFCVFTIAENAVLPKKQGCLCSQQIFWTYIIISTNRNVPLFIRPANSLYPSNIYESLGMYRYSFKYVYEAVDWIFSDNLLQRIFIDRRTKVKNVVFIECDQRMHVIITLVEW